MTFKDPLASVAIANAKTYADFSGLEQLKAQSTSNKNAALHEVAQQFESVFLSMVMQSMRQANSEFKSDLLGSDQMEFYQDMFDKQLALSMSHSTGVGLAEVIERQLSQSQPYQTTATNRPFTKE